MKHEYEYEYESAVGDEDSCVVASFDCMSIALCSHFPHFLSFAMNSLKLWSVGSIISRDYIAAHPHNMNTKNISPDPLLLNDYYHFFLLFLQATRDTSQQQQSGGRRKNINEKFQFFAGAGGACLVTRFLSHIHINRHDIELWKVFFMWRNQIECKKSRKSFTIENWTRK